MRTDKGWERILRGAERGAGAGDRDCHYCQLYSSGDAGEWGQGGDLYSFPLGGRAN